MPLTKTPETNIIFDPSAKFEMPEHTGGDGWTILHGDCLRLMRQMQDGVFDAVITDPPYASGGSTPAEKNKTTNQKYSSMPADKALPDFAGDQMDQRSWTNFMTDWLNEAYRLCKPGAPICLFIDWRQLPSMTPLSTYPFPIFFEEWGLDVRDITSAWDNKGVPQDEL